MSSHHTRWPGACANTTHTHTKHTFRAWHVHILHHGSSEIFKITMIRNLKKQDGLIITMIRNFQNHDGRWIITGMDDPFLKFLIIVKMKMSHDVTCATSRHHRVCAGPPPCVLHTQVACHEPDMHAADTNWCTSAVAFLPENAQPTRHHFCLGWPAAAAAPALPAS